MPGDIDCRRDINAHSLRRRELPAFDESRRSSLETALDRVCSERSDNG